MSPKLVVPERTPSPAPAQTSKVEPKAQPTPTPRVEPRIAPKVEPKAQPTPTPRVEPKAQPTPTLRVEPKAQPIPTPRVEPKAQPTPTPRVEPRVAPKVEPRRGPRPMAPEEPRKESVESQGAIRATTKDGRQLEFRVGENGKTLIFGNESEKVVKPEPTPSRQNASSRVNAHTTQQRPDKPNAKGSQPEKEEPSYTPPELVTPPDFDPNAEQPRPEPRKANFKRIADKNQEDDCPQLVVEQPTKNKGLRRHIVLPQPGNAPKREEHSPKSASGAQTQTDPEVYYEDEEPEPPRKPGFFGKVVNSIKSLFKSVNS